MARIKGVRSIPAEGIVGVEKDGSSARTPFCTVRPQLCRTSSLYRVARGDATSEEGAQNHEKGSECFSSGHSKCSRCGIEALQRRVLPWWRHLAFWLVRLSQPDGKKEQQERATTIVGRHHFLGLPQFQTVTSQDNAAQSAHWSWNNSHGWGDIKIM